MREEANMEIANRENKIIEEVKHEEATNFNAPKELNIINKEDLAKNKVKKSSLFTQVPVDELIKKSEELSDSILKEQLDKLKGNWLFWRKLNISSFNLDAYVIFNLTYEKFLYKILFIKIIKFIVLFINYHIKLLIRNNR